MTAMIINEIKSARLNELAYRAYENAQKHGFHEGNRENEHWLCLVICELSEAVEADRKDRRAKLKAFDLAMREPVSPHEAASPEEIYDYWFEAYIKDSVEDELADAAIRMLDLAGLRCWNLEDITSEVLTDKAISDTLGFTAKVYSLERCLMNLNTAMQARAFLEQLFYVADGMGIRLAKYIELKMTYNEHRPFKHGKEY